MTTNQNIEAIYSQAANAEASARRLVQKMRATTTGPAWGQYRQDSIQAVAAIALQVSAATAECGRACDRDDLAGAQAAAAAAKAALKAARAASRDGAPADTWTDDPE